LLMQEQTSILQDKASWIHSAAFRLVALVARKRLPSLLLSWYPTALPISTVLKLSSTAEPFRQSNEPKQSKRTPGISTYRPDLGHMRPNIHGRRPNQTLQPTPSQRRERLKDEWSEWW